MSISLLGAPHVFRIYKGIRPSQHGSQPEGEKRIEIEYRTKPNQRNQAQLANQLTRRKKIVKKRHIKKCEVPTLLVRRPRPDPGAHGRPCSTWAQVFRNNAIWSETYSFT